MRVFIINIYLISLRVLAFLDTLIVRLSIHIASLFTHGLCILAHKQIFDCLSVLALLWILVCLRIDTLLNYINIICLSVFVFLFGTLIDQALTRIDLLSILIDYLLNDWVKVHIILCFTSLIGRLILIKLLRPFINDTL